MDFYEVIRTRRSVRSYKPDPIPQKVLNKVLDAARIAPSGSNRQPWGFIVVKDEDLKSLIRRVKKISTDTAISNDFGYLLK